MLRSIKYAIISIFAFASVAHGQALPIRNDTPSNLRDLGSNLQVGRNFSVSQKGEIFITSATGATSLGKTEDTLASSGDVGVGALCRVNASGTTVTVSNGDSRYGNISCFDTGTLQTAVIGRALGVSLARLEDDTWTSGDAMAVVGGVGVNSLVTAQSSGTETANLTLDRMGRLITNHYIYQDGWSSCSSSNTGTSDVAIKAAVASNRSYVTSISCFNTSAVASSISFKDGTTQIYAGGIGASTTEGVGVYATTLPTPIRTTINTAFNFAMGTTATATTCCAAGYNAID